MRRLPPGPRDQLAARTRRPASCLQDQETSLPPGPGGQLAARTRRIAC